MGEALMPRRGGGVKHGFFYGNSSIIIENDTIMDFGDNKDYLYARKGYIKLVSEVEDTESVTYARAILFENDYPGEQLDIYPTIFFNSEKYLVDGPVAMWGEYFLLCHKPQVWYDGEHFQIYIDDYDLDPHLRFAAGDDVVYEYFIFD